MVPQAAGVDCFVASLLAMTVRVKFSRIVVASEAKQSTACDKYGLLRRPAPRKDGSREILPHCRCERSEAIHLPAGIREDSLRFDALTEGASFPSVCIVPGKGQSGFANVTGVASRSGSIVCICSQLSCSPVLTFHWLQPKGCSTPSTVRKSCQRSSIVIGVGSGDGCSGAPGRMRGRACPPVCRASAGRGTCARRSVSPCSLRRLRRHRSTRHPGPPGRRSARRRFDSGLHPPPASVPGGSAG